MNSEWRLVEKLPCGERSQLFLDGKPTRTFKLVLGDDPTLDSQVSQPGDDGSRYTGTGGFSADRSIDYIGYYPSADMRECGSFHSWRGVTLGPTIEEAYISIYVRGTPENAPELKVHVVMADNPVVPTSGEEYDSAPLSPGVDWDGPFIANEWNNSPSLVSEFQTLVNLHQILDSTSICQVRNDKSTYGVLGIGNFEFGQGARLHIVYTEAPTPPLAAFIASPLSGPAPLTVNFLDRSTGSIDSWLWDFGDGTTSGERDPSHIYIELGSYTVTLTVTGGAGQSSSFTQVEVLAPEAPFSSFTAVPVRGEVPLTVQFTNQSTGGIESFLWDFGDGATSTQENPIHTFSTVSLFTVTLTVTGSGGGSSSDMVIEVLQPAAADATQPGWLELVPTYKCIGVYANYNGDSNKNNNALMEYRRMGSEIWKPGVPLTPDKRDRLYIAYDYVDNPYANQFRGSIFGLSPNTEYEVRVTFFDPDGVVGTNPVVATIRTRDDTFSLGSGNEHFVSPDGDDGNDGSSTSPWLTIQHALDSSAPGDTITLRSGLYLEQLVLNRSGSPGNYLTIRSMDGEVAVIDGGNIDIALLFENASWVHLERLTIRNAARHCILLQHQSQNNVINNCIIEDFGYAGPESGVGLTTGSDWNTIQNSIIRNGRNTPRPEDSSGPALVDWIIHQPAGISAYYIGAYGEWPSYAQKGLVVRNCEIYGTGTGPTGYGMGDAFGGEYNTFLDRDGLNRDSDFYDNFIHDISDDMCEAEGSDMNVRIWGNRGWNTLVGIGLHSPVVGPAYILYNQFLMQRSSILKCGSGSNNPFAGDVYIWNNTGYTTYSAEGRVSGLSQDGGLLWLNHHLRNNIFVTSGYCFDITPYASVPGLGNDYDYDCLYQPFSLNGNTLVRFDGTIYGTITDFRAASGYELHGQGGYDSLGNPLLSDPDNGDVSLQPNSPCIDTGVVLTGINDPESPWAYRGSAPDIGAVESDYTGTPAPREYLNLNVRGQGATLPVAGIHDYSQGEAVQLNATPASGWAFIGWEENSIIFSSQPQVSLLMDTSRTVTAVFEAIGVRLTLAVMGQGNTIPPPGEHDYIQGDYVQLIAVPAAGWMFLHWLEDGAELDINPQISVQVNTDRLITAVFDEIPVPPEQYAVSISVLGEGSTEPSPGPYVIEAGQNLEVTAIPAEGWVFDHWEGDVSGEEASISVLVNSNLSILAVFLEQSPSGGNSPAVFIASGIAMVGIITAVALRRRR